MALQPTTERIRASRRGPALVALAALTLLGVLVAQPWEERAPASTPVAALASPSPTAIPTPSPSEPPTPAPTGTPALAPLPTPDLAPLGPGGEFALSAPPDSALVRCAYSRAARDRRTLSAVVVLPPRVVLNPAAQETDINRIGWWVELESNRQESVFDRDWQIVGRSRRQMATARIGEAASFSPLSMRYGGRDVARTDVFRVRVVIEWYTRNFEVAGHTEIVANTYQEAGDELIGAWPPYCAGVRISS